MKFSEIYRKSKGEGTLIEDAEIAQFSILRTAKKNSVVYVRDEKYLKIASINKNISFIIAHKELKGKISDVTGYLLCDEPEAAFYDLRRIFLLMTFQESDTVISVNSFISNSAVIAKKNVFIGENSYIDDNVVIKSGVRIGDNVTVSAGSIIGGEGLMVQRKKPYNQIVKHDGSVIINDNVVIQTGCNIDLGIFGWDTVVGKGSILDSHVHVAHGVSIGENVIIAAKATLSGFVIIENNAFIGPHSTIAPFLRVGTNSKVSIGSTVVGDVPDNETFTGYFARKHREFLKTTLYTRRASR